MKAIVFQPNPVLGPFQPNIFTSAPPNYQTPYSGKTKETKPNPRIHEKKIYVVGQDSRNNYFYVHEYWISFFRVTDTFTEKQSNILIEG